MSEGNVVSLLAVRKAQELRKKDALIEVVLGSKSPLEEGDLIALLCPRGSSHVMFTRWLGSTGRGIHGQFVRKGSPYEHFQLDNGLAYYAEQLHDGTVQILGVVLGARLSGESRDGAA